MSGAGPGAAAAEVRQKTDVGVLKGMTWNVDHLGMTADADALCSKSFRLVNQIDKAIHFVHLQVECSCGIHARVAERTFAEEEFTFRRLGKQQHSHAFRLFSHYYNAQGPTLASARSAFTRVAELYEGVETCWADSFAASQLDE